MSIAQDMVEGLACSQCGTYFKEPHDYPVLCTTCFDGLDERGKGEAEANGLQRAVMEEL